MEAFSLVEQRPFFGLEPLSRVADNFVERVGVVEGAEFLLAVGLADVFVVLDEVEVDLFVDAAATIVLDAEVFF